MFLLERGKHCLYNVRKRGLGAYIPNPALI